MGSSFKTRKVLKEQLFMYMEKSKQGVKLYSFVLISPKLISKVTDF